MIEWLIFLVIYRFGRGLEKSLIVINIRKLNISKLKLFWFNYSIFYEYVEFNVIIVYIINIR